MTITSHGKTGRRIAHALVVVWLLCQVMIFCTEVFSFSGLPSSDSMSFDFVQANILTGLSHPDHAIAGHQATQLLPSAVLDMDDRTLNNGCCAEENVYLTSIISSVLLIPILMFFILDWPLNQARLLVHRMSYLEKRSFNFNYPRPHLINCLFLN